MAVAGPDGGLSVETLVCRVVGGALAAGIVRVRMASCRVVVWSRSEETGCAVAAGSAAWGLPVTVGIG